MKKFLIPIIVLSLFASTSVLTSFAGDDSEKGIIHVNSAAETEIAPDVAEISFAVKTSDVKSMQNATVLNKVVSEKVFSELQGFINPRNGDYIKTADFNATPVYSYSNSKKVFDKYEVSNRVIVHTKSIENVGKMIDKAIAAGATNVDNLQFTVSNYENQCNNLITVATKKAKTRADIIANALATNVEGLNNISTSCSLNNSNSPRLYLAKNMIADVASETSGGVMTTISSGVVKINANVNASFYVK